MEKKKISTRRKRIYDIFSFVFAFIFLTSFCIIVGQKASYYEYEKNIRQYDSIDSVDEWKINLIDEDLLNKGEINNPINFNELLERNNDVYAWIYIPGLDISYPILQNDEDNYYLDKNIDRNSSRLGCIYTNKINSKNFDDFNTIIYGHNVIDVSGNMFSSLHNLSNQEVFDEVDIIIIYTPKKIFIYDLYSVVRFYKNTYIPYDYNFNSEIGRQNFIDMTFNDSQYDGGKLREGITVSTDDNLITLSTCMLDMRFRLLVVGKLKAVYMVEKDIKSFKD